MSAKLQNEGAGQGFPHLVAIKDSINLLYKCLSSRTIHSFSRCLRPEEAELPTDKDIDIAVQTLAGRIVRHLQLPVASIVVRFCDLDVPGRVELTPDDTYLVELHSKYRWDHRDVAAVLAHEATHVFLHRHGIQKFDTLANGILSVTASIYLGVGWLGLAAHRITKDVKVTQIDADVQQIRTTITDERLGYLTPDEFGYVLGKRALAFEEPMDDLLCSPSAQKAYRSGYRQAQQDHWQAPLAKCGWWRRLKYCWNRRSSRKMRKASGVNGASHAFEGYSFETGESLRVIFECPVCSQRLRVPTDQRMQVRCGVCGVSFECRT